MRKRHPVSAIGAKVQRNQGHALTDPAHTPVPQQPKDPPGALPNANNPERNRITQIREQREVRNTAGGYPRIGNIISAHLPKLAQRPAGSSIRFGITDIATAEQMLFSQIRDSSILQRSCRDHLTQLHAHH